MQIQILKGLLVAAIFSSIMAAQPPTVTIQSTAFVGGPDFALSGLQLVPIDTAEHAGAVRSVLADDADLLAPLLPYSVLLVNGSGKKLLGVGVEYHWKDAISGEPGGGQMVLTALTQSAAANIIHPGGIKLFTPSHAANRYLSISPAKRKAQPPSPGVSAAVSIQDEMLQDIQRLLAPAGLTNVRVAIDSVIFEDHSYMGSQNILEMLQRNYPEVHR